MNSILRKLSLAAVLFSFVLAGCASFGHKQQALHQSSEYYNYLQPSFDQYIDQSLVWLQDNRGFISEDREKELRMNMPFQLSPEQATQKAILLVHGLGDSPFTFSDLSKDLQAQGFHVEVLLLPGHGSKPADLLLPEYQDWRNIVDHYADLLKQQYEEVWLGGFSTGANLVTTHAIEQGDIDGLLLFSPGFQSQTVHLEKLTPVLAGIFDWSWREEETNLAKYSSSTFKAGELYMRSARQVRRVIEQDGIHIPTLIVMTEADSIIDADAVKAFFTQHVTHPASRLLWYGESEQMEDNILVKSMQLPMLRISTASHMSVMFKPCNHYYGIKGEKLICENGFNRDDKASCEQGAQVWYSAWGYTEEGKIYARLTWNPHYSHMTRLISDITRYSTSDMADVLHTTEDLQASNDLGLVAKF